MYTVKNEIRVILEKEDILALVKDLVSEDVSWRLGEQLPEDYEGEFKSIEWTKEGEILVTLE